MLNNDKNYLKFRTKDFQLINLTFEFNMKISQFLKILNLDAIIFKFFTF